MPRPRLLFLAHLLPWPLDGGGQIKSYHVLRALAERHDVTLVSLIRREEERAGARHLGAFCAGGIQMVRLRRGLFPNLRNAARALARRESFLVGRDRVREMDEVVRGALAGGGFAAVHVDHLQMAQYVPAGLGTPVVLDQHNVEHRIVRRVAETPGANLFVRWFAGAEWPKLRDSELAAMRRADAVLAVSDADRGAFLALAPDLSGRAHTVPIGVDTGYFAVAARDPAADTLLSIGTLSWPPNIDGLRWFAAEVLPLIRAERPGVRVSVVGANPAPAVLALGKRDPAITIAGTVPDVRPYAKGCGLFIVPLRSGSGVRVKILNALSMGLPVVSTTVGAEGLAVTHGENILIADTPREFADAVCRVLDDRALAARLGENGRALVEREYTWAASGERLHAVYDQVVGKETIR